MINSDVAYEPYAYAYVMEASKSRKDFICILTMIKILKNRSDRLICQESTDRRICSN